MTHGQSKLSWLPLVRGKDADPTTLLIVSCGGAGLVPFAPGTVGTLAAWMVVAALPQVPQLAWLAIAAAAFVVGCIYVERAERVAGVHDPGWVVIDEAVAYWLIYGCLGGDVLRQAAIFFAFRFFDVVKPPPARRIDREWRNGLGVMADDVAAALWTCAALALAFRFLG